MKYRIPGLAALVATTVILSACSGAPVTDESEGPLELTAINVSVSPSAATSVPMYLGVEKGFFQERGLDVTISVLANGTVAIPQVVSGQNQFSAASFAPVVEAVEQGLPIQVVGAANIIPTDDDTEFQGIIVRADFSGDDLSGASSIAAQSALLDPVQADSVEHFGADYESLSIVQVPLPSIGDTVASGGADFGVLNQPFLSMALANPDLKLLSYITPDESLPGTPGAVYIGQVAYMQANPEVTQAFMEAVVESYTYAQENQQEAADFVPETGLSDQVPPLVALGEYAAGGVSKEKFQELLDLFSEWGVNPGGITADDLLYQP